MAEKLAMSDGPAEAGVAHINAHGNKEFGGVLRCGWTKNKGRICQATRTFTAGEVILRERPLHIVQEQEDSPAFKKLQSLCTDYEDDFDYEPLWYWCAVQSLTAEELKGAETGCSGASKETQRNLLLLHHEDVDEPSSAAEILARELCPGADAMTLENLIQVWVLNCFEYSDTPQGYSTYFFSSFMSHSCHPNAVWHYTGADHVLRARRDIKIGDEVCISYLPESRLLASAPVRRMELHETKRFWCDCERCAEGLSDYSRGLFCPGCADGTTVFAKTPVAGPAKDASMLVSQWVGACTKCGHKVTKAEASKLLAHENKLQEIVDKYTAEDAKEPTQAHMEQTEKFIDEHFAQHALADLAWEQLCQFYAVRRRVTDQRRLLERRIAFHEAAYPGLSGAHAWALEALGDAMAKGSPSQTQATQTEAGRKKKRTWQVAAKEDQEAAHKLFGESLVILRKMFGSDHEYVTDVERKQRLLPRNQSAEAAS